MCNFRIAIQNIINMKLYRIILPVNNIDQAEKFYSEILGRPGSRVSPGRHYFNLGEMVLACYDPKADGDDYGAGWKFHENQYIYISVKNIQDVFKRIKNTDSQYVGSIEEMPWGETLFYTKDPFGNPICFVDEKTTFRG